MGSGSGYLTAALARLAKELGAAQVNVVGLESLKELAEQSVKNIHKDDPDLLKEAIDTIIVQDGWYGWPDGAPYDAIHVGAAAEKLPEKLAEQLAEGGAMVVPIGDSSGQMFCRFTKVNSEVQCEEVAAVRFVPLIHQKAIFKTPDAPLTCDV